MELYDEPYGRMDEWMDGRIGLYTVIGLLVVVLLVVVIIKISKK